MRIANCFGGRRFGAAAVVASLLVAGGCASGPDVRADYDRSADFGRFRTFGFIPTPDGGSEFRSLSVQQLEASATREMEARGYRKAEQPDLLIAFKGQLEEKTDVQSTPTTTMGVGYRGWYGAPYGAYGFGMGTEVTTRHYKVGTLVMDIIDREKQQAVFQGGVEGVVTKDMLKDRAGTIDRAVTGIFQQFPFVAGQSAPVAPPAKK